MSKSGLAAPKSRRNEVKADEGGWIILDKPSGMTSRAAGGRVARMFGIKKFGHLGTLDPMASGVLPIALGEATKMIPYLEHRAESREHRCQKEYEFSVQWGIKTDTDDITGKVMEQNDSVPSGEQISAALSVLVGEIEQTPPAYSAVHIGGRRAYELARRGAEFEVPARRVNIYELEVCRGAMLAPGRARHAPTSTEFRVQCSAGTYVRALAQQIVDEINNAENGKRKTGNGFICTCDSIRRTRTHNFEIKDAAALDFLENLYNNACRAGAEAKAEHQPVLEYLKPVDFGLDDILVLEIGDKDAELFKNGGFIDSNGDGLRRIYNNGGFIGIGEIINGQLRPKRIITSH
ncbi:MAG: tRNA pseudouridine(55) synthase TruB [Alphaproteobacteria bacterium]|nr:tRNA pseudouridine(55) synthase TruB [Alphaproteobacteria bacterium]